MKWLSIIVMCATLTVAAQNTGKLENQKDAWGVNYTYLGEMKNGKPNGMGIAKYSSNRVLRYVGSFVNGMYSGKGTMLFSSGAFLCGNWKDGKLNGKGTNLTADGSLYMGGFLNGEKNGTGTLIYKNNSFLKGSFVNDKINGRCVNLWTEGKTINDNLYKDGKRNGAGFQYEVTSKKLFEGEWKDDRWVDTKEATYASFLKSPAFVGEQNDDHVLIGPVDTKGMLRDTAYYYDLKDHKRYFGFYQYGRLKEGLLIQDDSSRFVGKLDDIGATGYGYSFKFNGYYSEGNYVKDVLNGEILNIDLKNKTVYYGFCSNGEFTGKACFFNNKNEMYMGDYQQGRFTGQGIRVESTGRTVSGTWKEGESRKVNYVVGSDGKTIPAAPRSFSEAANMAIKDYWEQFENLEGDEDLEFETDNISDLIYDATTYSSFMSFPGAAEKDRVVQDFESNNFYLVTYINTTDSKKARAKYEEIAKQVQALTISNKFLTRPVRMKGTITPYSSTEKKIITQFTVASENSDISEKFHIWVQLVKDDDDNYIVYLEIGEMEQE